jgi:IS30 family transposase
MAQEQYIREAREFQHLSLAERGEIKALLREGHGPTAIAERIGRHKSTVSREIRRGTATQLNSDLTKRYEYFAETGAAVYAKNRERSRNAMKIGDCAEFIGHADEKLKGGWSPDAVAGRAKISPEWAGKPLVCTKTLYNYIGKGLLKTKNIDLALKVRRRPKSKRDRRNKRILGESIEKRPPEVEKREEFGHWEIDSVIGRKSDKTAVATLVERKTRNQIVAKLDGRGSEAADKAAQDTYASFGENAKEAMKSVTGDNGSEFSGLKDALECAVYFCHPYSSWEKGTNERHNGLLRRFIKKGKSIDSIPAELIAMAAEWNNNLPRKILGYRTPAEAFADEMRKIEEARMAQPHPQDLRKPPMAKLCCI